MIYFARSVTMPVIAERLIISPDHAAKHKQSLRAHRGVVSVSPYDVPKALWLYHDDIKNAFVFVFQYSSTKEKISARQIDDRVRISIGSNSGKIHRAEVNLDIDSPLRSVTAELTGVIEQLISELSNSYAMISRKLNYLTIKDFLNSSPFLNSNDLLATESPTQP